MIQRLARFALSALLAASLCANARAANGTALTLQPAHPGEGAAFAFSFEGNFGPSHTERLEDTVSFRRGAGNAVIVNAQQSKPFTITTTRSDDGLLAVPDTPSALGDLIVDYNTIARLVARPGTRSLHAGDEWQTQIPVRVSPTTWQDIPVEVAVSDANDSRVALEAAGHQESTLYFQGFTFPIDVTVHVTEAFVSGRLASADLSVNEITAGGSGPPIAYAWHFTAR
jgi:hypothetical protein